MTDTRAHAHQTRALQDSSTRTTPAPAEETQAVRRHTPAAGLVHAPAAAQTIRRSFDKGWLAEHEGVGHTLGRHVGKSDAWLVNRVNTEKVSAASSFPDQDTAEAWIAAAIQKNQADIDTWLAGGGKKFVFDHSPAQTTGRSVDKVKDGKATEADVHDVKNLRVVLTRVVVAGKPAYRVLTAYPR